MIKIGDRWVDPEQVAEVVAHSNGESYVTLKTMVDDSGGFSVNDYFTAEDEDPDDLADRINSELAHHPIAAELSSICTILTHIHNTMAERGGSRR